MEGKIGGDQVNAARPGLRSLVCFALEDEARSFRKLVLGRDGVSILVTGIGAENTQRAVENFLRKNSPTRIFTCGFAGGLNPQLKSSDVIFETDDDSLREKLRSIGAKPAKFHCAALIVTTALEKARLRRETNADAVEMESDIVRQICRERKIPCATVRVISDTAAEDMPLDFNELAKADRNIHYGKLMMAIAKSPGKIPALMRLQKVTQAAATELARALQKAIE